MTAAKPVVVIASTFLPVPLEHYLGPLEDVAEAHLLPELEGADRDGVLRAAEAIIMIGPHEFAPGEIDKLEKLRFVQTITTGVDHLPSGLFPAGIPMGNTAGAAAKAIAEHGLALALAAVKRLPVEHNRLMAGRFGYARHNRMLSGGTACILGFGEIGRECAALFKALDMRVEALNRSGATDAPVDRVGTLDDLDAALERCDLLVIAASLNDATRNRIGPEELARMKPDATILILSRAEIVRQKALYDHLVANPGFTACIDTWWSEIFERDSPFSQDYPFMELPNVVGSPHNSGLVPGVWEEMVRRASANVRAFLTGEGPLIVVPEADRP